MSLYHGSTQQVVREDLFDLSHYNSLPLASRDHRTGWLRFILTGVSNDQVSAITAIALRVVDALGNFHRVTLPKAQWQSSGKLINRYVRELEALAEDLDKRPQQNGIE